MELIGVSTVQEALRAVLPHGNKRQARAASVAGRGPQARRAEPEDEALDEGLEEDEE
jgi:hypothetical protein